MKKQYVPIVTLSLAILLVGSIAYASEKRKKARPAVPDTNELSEETLKAELLAANGSSSEKLPVKAANPDKNAAVTVKMKK